MRAADAAYRAERAGVIRIRGEEDADREQLHCGVACLVFRHVALSSKSTHPCASDQAIETAPAVLRRTLCAAGRQHRLLPPVTSWTTYLIRSRPLPTGQDWIRPRPSTPMPGGSLSLYLDGLGRDAAERPPPVPGGPRKHRGIDSHGAGGPHGAFFWRRNGALSTRPSLPASARWC